MKSYFYEGEGTSRHFLPGHPLTAPAITETPWEASCSLLIMPGGRDRPYHFALRGEGCRRIRQFVENGGTYLGICAGAYFGAKRIEFDRGFPLEVCEERELAFFAGSAIGPAYGKGTYDYNSQKGARAAKLKTEDGKFYAYYNGGCTFEGDLSRCQILARYADLPNSPPAILECRVGKGKAILSGVHIETSPHDLDPTDPDLAKILPQLILSNPKRAHFWQFLSQNP